MVDWHVSKNSVKNVLNYPKYAKYAEYVKYANYVKYVEYMKNIHNSNMTRSSVTVVLLEQHRNTGTVVELSHTERENFEASCFKNGAPE
jgi:hypothetical protein